MPFPSPPWKLRGHLWLSLFPGRDGGTPHARQPGLRAIAFVDYQEGGVLSYQELLVARLVRDGAVPRVNITDIWVNSEPSRAGGRSLWAIPKELADLHIEDRWLGPAANTSCSANIGGSPLAAAKFAGVHRPALRTPFRFTTSQRREDGKPVVTRVSGSAKTLPCLGTWDFAADGPLAWLHGRQSVLNLRMSDFRLTFGA